jgi:regulator of protease activity HflC (stomatin/prohibitin superfamily)
MQNQSPFALLIFFVILLSGAGLAYALHVGSESYGSYAVFGGTFFIAFIVSAAIKVANQWDRAIVLRLGHFHALRGPGLFFIIPVIDTIAYWIDIRVITTAFKAEKTLSKDTVPMLNVPPYG